mmetsp:Transcript_788/g.1055  ORF Transcript_788/g.1055 Transcript_788/m.1055 type:complete len:214 (-) Transcript_788:508-1149(-)
MFSPQSHHLRFKRLQIALPSFKIRYKKVRADKTLLLFEHCVFVSELITHFFGFGEFIAQLCDAIVKNCQLCLQTLVFYLYELQLLFDVCQDLHCSCCLLFQLVKLIVPFFNFLVECLVFDLQLLKVDEVKALCKLLLLLDLVFQLFKLVQQVDVFQPHFCDLSILLLFVSFKCQDPLQFQRFSCSRVPCLSRNLSFECFERIAQFCGFLILPV